MQKDTEREHSQEESESPFGEDDAWTTLSFGSSYLMDGSGWPLLFFLAKEKLKELSALIIILVGPRIDPFLSRQQRFTCPLMIRMDPEHSVRRTHVR